MALLVAALIIWRHRENIRRLRDGTESRFKA
jgi:glycerol-3-phosphate acyltransferase PlsY